MNNSNKVSPRVNSIIGFPQIILFVFLVVVGIISCSENSFAATHLNISIVETVNQTVYYNFDANLSQNITYYNVTGIINITNPANETVNDIYITFIHTDQFITNLTNISGRPGQQISGTPGQPFIVHIPELRENESTIFSYLLKDNNSLTPPLLMETNYTHKGWAKIIADRDMRVVSFVENQAQIGYPIENINISIKAQNITWGSETQWFQLHTLSSTGDYSNVSNTANQSVWYWNVNNGTLPFGERRNITYMVHVPANIPESGFYNATIDSLSYSIAYALSNLTVSEINASAKSQLNLQKEIWEATETYNVTWRGTPEVSTDTDITFDLKAMTVWVTRDMNPNNYTGLNYSYPASNLTTFNRTNPWGGNVSEYAWLFNYTDGSNPVTAPPPILWMDADYIIYNGLNQLINQSITRNGEDIYIRQIYIINGFWLEVDKNITNIAQDMYMVKVWVHNKGTGWTPTNLTVTVYDFVPTNFTAWNYTPYTPNNTRNVGGGSEYFTGQALMWYIGLKPPKNASLAPNNASSLLDEWNTTYYVNGSGDYKVSDLYIVGLDPQLVDGDAGVSPMIVIVTSLVNYGKELMYMFIALALVATNTVIIYKKKKSGKKLFGSNNSNSGKNLSLKSSKKDNKKHNHDDDEIRRLAEEIESLKRRIGN